MYSPLSMLGSTSNCTTSYLLHCSSGWYVPSSFNFLVNWFRLTAADNIHEILRVLCTRDTE